MDCNYADKTSLRRLRKIGNKEAEASMEKSMLPY